MAIQERRKGERRQGERRKEDRGTPDRRKADRRGFKNIEQDEKKKTLMTK